LDKTREPHDRGAILVAAVFGAFLKVYRAKTADLIRIATEGTGVLRAGDIHPDLVNRLADEAARCARTILQMCIRAIDYCPPVGITFGDYLRGIVTADHDLNPDDPDRYRLAFFESFRSWGITPVGMPNMSLQTLLWPKCSNKAGSVSAVAKFLTKLLGGEISEEWDLESDRQKAWSGMDSNCAKLWRWLVQEEGKELAPQIGVVLDKAPNTVFRSTKDGKPSVEIHSVRTARRRTARGSIVADLVVEIAQRRRGYYDPKEQETKDKPDYKFEPTDRGDFRYRAGCTLLMNAATKEVRYMIRTPRDVCDEEGLKGLRRFLTEGGLDPSNAFALARKSFNAREPFALLHRHEETF
jgi:hypothetical protein